MSEIERVGPKSSSVIVKIAELSEILALVAFERNIFAVSFVWYKYRLYGGRPGPLLKNVFPI